jgi:hypothetical protein
MIVPMSRPMMVSLITAPATPDTVAGRTGANCPNTGNNISDSARAKDSRIRIGTKVSPIPGISMIMVASRVKTRPAANTCWAVA